MQLYLLTRTDPIKWDEYNGAVIAALSHEEAKKIMYDLEDGGFWKSTLIADIAKPRIKPGIVLSSCSDG